MNKELIKKEELKKREKNTIKKEWKYLSRFRKVLKLVQNYSKDYSLV